jgi:hypothetical protein
MTGKVSQSVVSDHSMKSSCRSVRSNPGACGAVAGAGILTLGLVAAPPPISHGRTEVRAVLPTSLALLPAAGVGRLE